MNCKPGDLAIVIGYKNRPHLLGLIIKISHRSDMPERFPNYWLTNPIFYDGNTRIHFDDNNLRPIRPDESPEESQEAMRLLTQISQKEKI